MMEQNPTLLKAWNQRLQLREKSNKDHGRASRMNNVHRKHKKIFKIDAYILFKSAELRMMQAEINWATAIRKVYGNITFEYQSDGSCLLSNGELYFIPKVEIGP